MSEQQQPVGGMDQNAILEAFKMGFEAAQAQHSQQQTAPAQPEQPAEQQPNYPPVSDNGAQQPIKRETYQIPSVF